MILFIYGAGGAAIEIYDLVTRNSKIKNKYSKIYFIDDFQEESEFYGTKRIKYVNLPDYLKNDEAEFIIANGEPSARKFLFDKIQSSGYSLTTLIDEKAIISPTAKISSGCVINHGSIISSNAVLNKNCLIMFNVLVGHDVVLENDCVISPKSIIGAHCNIGEETFVGMASSIIQGLNIGKNAIIGMGAMVFRDIPEDCTVIGNPASITKGNAKHRIFNQNR